MISGVEICMLPLNWFCLPQLSGARGVGNYVVHNPLRLKIFSFVGSLAVLAISIVSFLNVFNIASPALYVMNAYMIIFAFVLAVAESNTSWPGVQKLQNIIYEQFGFLKNNLGRGIFLVSKAHEHSRRCHGDIFTSFMVY
ncbi:hypothetical protein FOZ62_015359 [Perkinsus olseni]|uniref:Uncharacterized protein n=1 Tax=Perkinsus olseni TaxID=32597 RepID=A0A7J6SRC9_PEROL|nr:hypothetical protein FOZ62_015359 [Perkinsus olseni]